MATQQQVDNLQLRLTALQAQLWAQQAPQPPPTTAAAPLLLFELARLANFVQPLGMQCQDGMMHQAMANALAAVPGLTPHRAQISIGFFFQVLETESGNLSVGFAWESH
jgi:hypothetical protein